MRVQVTGFGVVIVRLGVEGSGFRDEEFGLYGLGFSSSGLGLIVSGLGMKKMGLRLRNHELGVRVGG